MSNGLIILIRVVGAIFLGFLGLWSGQALAEGDSGLVRLLFWTAIPIGFTIAGAVTAPVLLHLPLQKFQEWTRAIHAIQLILGLGGLLAGLLAGVLVSLALFTLPGIGGFIAPFVVSFVFGLLGAATMLSREEEFAAFLGRYLPGLGSGRPGSRDIIIDTSAVIDGRIADISQTGFVSGTLVVPRFVLDELRHIADSPDALRRNRGRRGLEILSRLQKETHVPVIIAEDDFEDAQDVDAKLIRLAKKRSAALLTNDFNLNRIAELEGLQVLNINQLANAVKAVVLPGEEMEVRIIQEGKEIGQGVAFLDDGTMVVVEGGRRYLNERLEVIVTRVLQTMAGRMIFAQPKGA